MGDEHTHTETQLQTKHCSEAGHTDAVCYLFIYSSQTFKTYELGVGAENYHLVCLDVCQ